MFVYYCFEIASGKYAVAENAGNSKFTANTQSRDRRIFPISTKCNYRGSSPNTHFGTRKKNVLGEIALFEDFGTILCKDTEKCTGARNRTNYSIDATFLVQNPKSRLSEIRVRRNRVIRGPPVV